MGFALLSCLQVIRLSGSDRTEAIVWEDRRSAAIYWSKPWQVLSVLQRKTSGTRGTVVVLENEGSVLTVLTLLQPFVLDSDHYFFRIPFFFFFFFVLRSHSFWKWLLSDTILSRPPSSNNPHYLAIATWLIWVLASLSSVLIFLVLQPSSVLVALCHFSCNCLDRTLVDCNLSLLFFFLCLCPHMLIKFGSSLSLPGLLELLFSNLFQQHLCMATDHIQQT